MPERSSTERYSRQIRFSPIGEEGQQRIQKSRVVVIGMGALGSVAADLLARAGTAITPAPDPEFLQRYSRRRIAEQMVAIFDALVAGRFGLSEPDPSLPPVEPDALIVPLAAFDRTGQRIGYGRGYYDGAIARLSRTRPVLTVGIGFAAQEVGRVPAEPHDRPLQFVITEDGVIRCDRTA